MYDQFFIFILILFRDWFFFDWKVDFKEFVFICEVFVLENVVLIEEELVEVDKEEFDEENYEYEMLRWKMFLNQYNEWVVVNKDCFDWEVEEVCF